MARNFVPASSEGLKSSDEGGISAFPFTLHAWGDVTNLADRPMVCHVDDTSNSLYILCGAHSDTFARLVSRGGGFAGVSGTTDITTTGFHSVVATFISNTSKKIFADGVEEGELTTSTTYSTSINVFSIGYLARLSPVDFNDGDIGFCAAWDLTLSDNEIAALGNGVNPWAIRNQNLVMYCQVNGNEDPEPNWANRGAFASPTNFVLTGTPTKSTTNPPVELLENYL